MKLYKLSGQTKNG